MWLFLKDEICEEIYEFNVKEVGVLLLVFNNGLHNLIKRLSLEVAVVQIQVLEVFHGSDGVAEKLYIAFFTLREPGLVIATSEVSDCRQAVTASQRRQYHITLSLILIITELLEVQVVDLGVSGQDGCKLLSQELAHILRQVIHPCQLQLFEGLGLVKERLHHRFVRGLNKMLFFRPMAPFVKD